MAYRRIAAFYDLLDLPFEGGRYRALRPILFAACPGPSWTQASVPAATCRSTRKERRSWAST